MATIAKLAIQLQADPNQAVKGLEVFKRAVATTGQKVSTMSSWINSVAGSMATELAMSDPFALARIGVEATTKTVQTLVGWLPKVGPALSAAAGALGAAAETIVNWFERIYKFAQKTFDEGAEKILAYRASAIQLGASFQEVGALAMAAGGNVERVTRAMTHLNSQIHAARTGDSGALALLSGKLGLNPEALARMSNTERFEAVIQGLSGIRDEMTKTHVELGIFGERTALAFGSLLKSGKGLEQFRQQFHRFGMDLGQTNPGIASAMAEQVNAAKRAWGQMDMAIDGIKMNIAAGLAPVILALSEKFKGVGVDAKWWQDVTISAAKGIGKAAAWTIDAWSGLQKVWYSLSAGFADFASSVNKGIGDILDRLSDLPEWAGGGMFHQMAEDARREAKVWDKVAAAARQARAQIAAAPGAMAQFDEFFADVQQRIDMLKEGANKKKDEVEPQIAPIQLPGAATAGSQEAYKTLGEFASMDASGMASRQLEAAKQTLVETRRNGVSLKMLERLMKRGFVRRGKI